MIVSDSSPIINLGKQGFFELLKKCFGKVIVPKAVFAEIMKKEDSIEAKAFEKGINEKWIIVEEVGFTISLTSELENKVSLASFCAIPIKSRASKEAISLVAKMDCLLLIDDDNGKKYASILNIESHRTIFVVFLSVLKKFINKEKAKKLFEDMVKEGFYVSTELYAEFLNLLERI